MTTTQDRPITGPPVAASAAVYPLQNEIRPYAWGSVTALPEFLGLDPTGQPAAELWMGTHPGAPSRLAEADATLRDLVHGDPQGTLGPEVAARFAGLPFLFKILAVDRPLSLQAHPTLEQAGAGYATEQAQGIAPDAPQRNYKDANHKPEQVCALTPFLGLYGFRPVAETARLLEVLDVEALRGYPERLVAEGGLRDVVTALLTMPDPVIADLLDELEPAFIRLSEGKGPWQDMAAALADLSAEYRHDRGVVIAMLLNLVPLQPGESTFLAPGVPHVHLQGTAVEIQANSDNVLRCGLTTKHVDVPELMRVLHVAQTAAPVLRPEPLGPGLWRHPREVPDFALLRVEPDEAGADGVVLPAGAPRIVLCTAGVLTVADASADDQPLAELGRGRSAFIPARAEVVIRTASSGAVPAQAYVATTNL